MTGADLGVMSWCSDITNYLDVDDKNNSYEITINGFQVRKINEIRNLISYNHFISLLVICSRIIQMLGRWSVISIWPNKSGVQDKRNSKGYWNNHPQVTTPMPLLPWAMFGYKHYTHLQEIKLKRKGTRKEQ